MGKQIKMDNIRQNKEAFQFSNSEDLFKTIKDRRKKARQEKQILIDKLLRKKKINSLITHMIKKNLKMYKINTEGKVRLKNTSVCEMCKQDEVLNEKVNENIGEDMDLEMISETEDKNKEKENQDKKMDQEETRRVNKNKVIKIEEVIKYTEDIENTEQDREK